MNYRPVYVLNIVNVDISEFENRFEYQIIIRDIFSYNLYLSHFTFKNISFSILQVYIIYQFLYGLQISKHTI